MQAIEIPPHASIELQCDYSSLEDEHNLLLNPLSRHFSPVMKNGDYFSHIKFDLSEMYIKIACSMPRGEDHSMPTSLSLMTTFTLSVSRLIYGYPAFPLFEYNVFDAIVAGVCASLPLRGNELSLQVTSSHLADPEHRPFSHTWWPAIICLPGVRMVDLNNVAAQQLFSSFVEERKNGRIPFPHLKKVQLRLCRNYIEDTPLLNSLKLELKARNNGIILSIKHEQNLRSSPTPQEHETSIYSSILLGLKEEFGQGLIIVEETDLP
jgi:hypothetical protein